MNHILSVPRITYPGTVQEAPQDVLVRLLGGDGEWARELRWRRSRRGEPGSLQVFIRQPESVETLHTGFRISARVLRQDPHAERIWDLLGGDVLVALGRTNPNKTTLLVTPGA